jgi:hypothetical protein
MKIMINLFHLLSADKSVMQRLVNHGRAWQAKDFYLMFKNQFNLKNKLNELCPRD